MAISRKDIARLVKDLDRERDLLPQLKELGVSEDELRVLQGDEALLKILAEEGPTAELEKVLEWHQARLKRVADEAKRT